MILVVLVKSGSDTLKTAPVDVDIVTTYSRIECPRGAVAELVGMVLFEDVSVGCTTAPTVTCEGGTAKGLAAKGTVAVVLGGSASKCEDDEAEVPEVACPRQSSSSHPSS